MGRNNGKALNAKVRIGDDPEILLSDLWEEKPLVLVFLRHFG